YENEIRIETEELSAFPEEEHEELGLIYETKGITPTAAHALVQNIIRRPDVAIDTLAREELGLDPARLGSPWAAAITSFLAFALGAVLPIVPYFFGSGTAPAIASALGSLLCLLAVGTLTSVFTGR